MALPNELKMSAKINLHSKTLYCRLAESKDAFIFQHTQHLSQFALS